MSPRFSSRLNRWLGRDAFPLEDRTLPSAAFDITGLTAMRNDPAFAGIDGELPGQPRNIGIAILDSGVWGGHPELRGNFVAYYDAVSNKGINGPIITDPNAFSWNGNKNGDPDGHGSHVAGTAASTNPELGVATGADLIGVRALGQGPNQNPVLNALNWVVANQAKFNIRVVNMSLGSSANINQTGLNDPIGLSTPIRQLENLGVTVVSASGNSYAQYAQPGAAYPAAISTISVANTWEDAGVGDPFPYFSGMQQDRFATVTFQTKGDTLAASSQRSSLPNQVAAPGTTILSTFNGAPDAKTGQPKLRQVFAGTSMASPFVAGVVALMQDASFTASGRYLAPANVLQILRDTADIITDAPTNTNAKIDTATGAKSDLAETGLQFRRVNVMRAVAAARGTVGGGQTGVDTNHVISKAVDVNALDGNRVYSLRGRIGTDGQTQIGNNDVDLFRIVTQSPGIFRALTSLPSGGTAFDSYLRIFNAAGSQIAFDDDGGTGAYSKLAISLTPGTYYVGVSSFNNSNYSITDGSNRVDGNSSGDYDLQFQLVNADPNGVFTGAVDLATAEFVVPVYDSSFSLFDDPGNPGVTGKVGFLVSGVIDSDPPAIDNPDSARIQIGSGDVDMFRFVAPDSGRLFVRAASVGKLFNQFNLPPGSLVPFDTFLRVFNAKGQQIAFDDDSGAGSDSQLVLNNVSKGEVLFFAVSTFLNSNYNPADPAGRTSFGLGGHYELFVTFDNLDLNGTAYTAVTLPSVGTPAGGTIGTDFGGPIIGTNGSLDVDFVRVTIPTDGIFRVTAAGNDGFIPTLDIWGFTFDSSGQVTNFSKIASSVQSKSQVATRVIAGRDYFISITGEGNGGYNWYLSASGTGGKTGTYTLTTELLPPDSADAIRDKGITGGKAPRIITLGSSLEGVIGSDYGLDGTEYVVEALSGASIVYGAGDIDTYRYDATVTGPVRVRVSSGAGLGQSGDPVLRVFTAEGTEIALNDDASDFTRDAEVVFDAVAGQTYYFGVTGYSSDAGNYDAMTGTGAAALAIAAVGPYLISVNAVNNAPTISDIANVNGVRNLAIGPIDFTVGDAETAPENLQLGAASSNPALIPVANIVFGGSGANRTVTLTPVAGQTGTATITITVTDADGGTQSDDFTVTVIAPPPANFSTAMDVGGGAVALLNSDGSVRFTLTPFGADFTGGIRTATADLNADGVEDLIVGSGPGRAGQVLAFDGANQQNLFNFVPFGDAFVRGVYVSGGDLTGDGRAEIIITADRGGGARIRIFTPNAAGAFTQLADFIGIIGGDGVADTKFRGGARSTVGDMNADGKNDLIFAAGTGGGPRVAIFNGPTLGPNGGPKLTGDFFVFEPTLRDGSNVTAGDVDGDGHAELIVGAGNGASRVRVLSGAVLIASNGSTLTALADFFAFGTQGRTGVRVAANDLDGDGRVDLIAGPGTNSGGSVRAYNSQALLANPAQPLPILTFDPFAGFVNGVFVG